MTHVEWRNIFARPQIQDKADDGLWMPSTAKQSMVYVWLESHKKLIIDYYRYDDCHHDYLVELIKSIHERSWFRVSGATPTYYDPPGRSRTSQVQQVELATIEAVRLDWQVVEAYECGTPNWTDVCHVYCSKTKNETVNSEWWWMWMWAAKQQLEDDVLLSPHPALLGPACEPFSFLIEPACSCFSKAIVQGV